MEIETRYGKAEIVLKHYHTSGDLAITLDDPDTGERIAVLTINMPEEMRKDANIKLDKDEILVKTWSENAGIAQDCLLSGYFRDTGKRVPMGFVEAHIWMFLKEGGEI